MKGTLALPAHLKRLIVLFLLATAMLAAQPLCTRPVCADAAPSAAQTAQV